MLDTVKKLLLKYNIDLCEAIMLKDCRIVRPYLLGNAGIDENGTAFIFAIPYYTTFCDDPSRNISAYAVSPDYHGFIKLLSVDIIPKLKDAFQKNKFTLFADHSPIDEIEAAAKSGLGVIGKNHLLITEKYSSYVFIGEIVTDARLEVKASDVTYCIDCGRCSSACPMPLPEGEFCMSALTQKKGVLTAEEASAILRHGIAWGCDRCQECCPYTERAKKDNTIYSKIQYFNENCISHLTSDILNSMSENEFSLRAYSWRNRETIMRNLSILESDKEN